MTTRTFIAVTLALSLPFAFAGCDSPDTAVEQGAETTAAREPAAEPASAQASQPTVVAYGRFVPEREDDFAWENDKVAFRIYGPASSGKGQVSGVDAWLKRVPHTVIDNWYAGHQEGVSYHEDHGEGYDPYHVGDSRGVGGTAVWIDGTPWPAGKFSRYEVHQGRGEEVEFTVYYEWETPLGMVAESKTISLALGDQLYRVHSVFTLDGEPASLPIAIGLTTHDGKAQVESNRELGRISTAETIDGHRLWTGALMAPGRTQDVMHAPSEEKDESHIWLLTATTDSGELTYRAGFAWEAAGDIGSFEQWNEYLDSRAGE